MLGAGIQTVLNLFFYHFILQYLNLGVEGMTSMALCNLVQCVILKQEEIYQYNYIKVFKSI